MQTTPFLPLQTRPIRWKLAVSTTERCTTLERFCSFAPGIAQWRMVRSRHSATTLGSCTAHSSAAYGCRSRVVVQLRHHQEHRARQYPARCPHQAMPQRRRLEPRVWQRRAPWRLRVARQPCPQERPARAQPGQLQAPGPQQRHPLERRRALNRARFPQTPAGQSALRRSGLHPRPAQAP